MEFEYYDVTSELDAREILRYLNNLGIQNISGEVLKHFIIDLKKLIKYDLQQKQHISDRPEPLGCERLHSASTFSSRIRSRCQQQSAPITCDRECQRPKQSGFRFIHSAPILGQRRAENNVIEKPLKRSCSCVRVEKKDEIGRSKERVTSSNSNIIKVPKQPVLKKCDPVSLYHYYTSLWAKYKSNVPGENDWADLRWHVRQKMAGQIPKPAIITKLQENHNKVQKTVPTEK